MIEEPDVNFGLVCLGGTITKQITLSNMAQITTKWTIRDSQELIDLENGDVSICLRIPIAGHKIVNIMEV